MDALPLGWVHIIMSDHLALAYPTSVYSPHLRDAIIIVTWDSWDPVQDDASSRVDSLLDVSSENSQVLSIDSASEDELNFQKFKSRLRVVLIPVCCNVLVCFVDHSFHSLRGGPISTKLPMSCPVGRPAVDIRTLSVQQN